ncbi:MAG: universal stress protein UspA [Betaproteobacteria bacterium HGW-Betaproteobacteria-5]|jgi:nucleotide-binding universal stress UspA family protein|nr:MAG: universal stress protein UspA [Betaproteobacteria bacterium HGW-Betaproteobacteria-5]PKO41173.1 MAG: universal stress protein UspA [Betaproteobacteria bacterium HGW-Betaproteobacteria-6]
MTILVAYAPRPEGLAALDKGIEIAARRGEYLLVVNASPGGSTQDSPLLSTEERENVEKRLAVAGIAARFEQFVRGKGVVEEIEELVDSQHVSLVVIGLRKRSPVGKLLLGSTAQDILLSVPCPVLAVKAG